MSIGFASPTPGLPTAVDSLVDERFGVISSVVQSPHERGEPPFFHFFAETAPTARWLPRRPFSYGGGASTSRDVAAAKAIGECVERYCAAIYDLDSMPLTSADAAPFECVDPTRFALFSPAQYAAGLHYRPFNSATPVRWVEARRVRDGRTVHVPASGVYLPYYGERRDEAPVIPPVSTGLAAGLDLESAALGGLLEVVERDAFCRVWYLRISPPKIARETLSGQIGDMVRRFECNGYSVALLDITSDLGIPVVLATACGCRDDAPALSLAASSSIDSEVAATKALEELAMTVRYQRDLALGRYKTVDLGGDLHLAYWNRRERRSDAEFLWSSAHEIALREMAPACAAASGRRLQWLGGQVAAHGFDAYVCDVTSDDVRSVGLVVARTIVPGLQPLLFGEGMVALGGTRLGEGPVNEHMHPFP